MVEAREVLNGLLIEFLAAMRDERAKARQAFSALQVECERQLRWEDEELIPQLRSSSDCSTAHHEDIRQSHNAIRACLEAWRQEMDEHNSLEAHQSAMTLSELLLGNGWRSEQCLYDAADRFLPESARRSILETFCSS